MADQQDQQDQHDGAGDDHISDDEGRQLLGLDNDKDGATDKGDSTAGKSETGQTDEELAKWKSLSRKNEKELRAAQAKLKEFEDAKLSESERLQKAHAELQDRASKAEAELTRMRIAAETAPENASLAQLRKVAKRMAGANDDELEADAKELWDDLGPGRSATPPPASKPKEKLKGGGDPDEQDEIGLDPQKLAALIPRAR